MSTEKQRSITDVHEVVVFDGEKARNHYHTDIDILLANFLMCYFGYWPFVKDGEVWIDVQNKEEIIHLLYVAILGELNTASTYSLEREKLAAFARAGGGEKVQPKILYEKKLFGFWKIKYVDGAQIRRNIDAHFSFGGHHEVYEYIPQYEVWIDVSVKDTEQQHIILHECVEWVLMHFFHLSYDFSHNFAIVIEEEHRRKKSGAIYKGEENFPWRHFSDEKLRQQMIVKKLKLRKDWYERMLKSKGMLQIEEILVQDEEFTQPQLL